MSFSIKTRSPRGAEMEAPLGMLQTAVDRLFEDFGRTERFLAPAELPAWWGVNGHAVDVVETDQEMKFTAELPGYCEKDLDVTLDANGLCIKGQKSEEKEQKNERFLLRERHQGSFERRFSLPEGVKTDKVEATYKDGLLTIVIPKDPSVSGKVRKLPIKAG